VTITERETEFSFYTPPLEDGIRDSGELVTFLLEAAKAVIVGTVKDDADPDKVAQEFGALLSRGVARTIRENREKAKGGEKQ
jgi:hypothetical protein